LVADWSVVVFGVVFITKNVSFGTVQMLWPKNGQEQQINEFSPLPRITEVCDESGTNVATFLLQPNL
jgi:hypothetical protein